MVIRGMSGNFAGQEFQVNGSLVFGRSPQGCNVLFPDNVKGVSRNHCKVESNGASVTITDIGSSYGTFLNGRKLAPYTPTPLNNGDTFYLGDRANSFSVSGAPAAGGGSPAKGGGTSSKNKNLIIGIAAGAIALVALAVILIALLGGRNVQIEGTTWKVAEVPGMRMSFAENGDILVTENGEFSINGSLTYSKAGDNKLSIKYTPPSDTYSLEAVGLFKILNIGGNVSITKAYSNGYIWNYKYDRKTKSVIISDVNGYKLFTLEKE